MAMSTVALESRRAGVQHALRAAWASRALAWATGASVSSLRTMALTRAEHGTLRAVSGGCSRRACHGKRHVGLAGPWYPARERTRHAPRTASEASSPGARAPKDGVRSDTSCRPKGQVQTAVRNGREGHAPHSPGYRATPAPSTRISFSPRRRAMRLAQAMPKTHGRPSSIIVAPHQVRRSGSGMNSTSSPGTFGKRPFSQSSFARSMRSFELETKFQ